MDAATMTPAANPVNALCNISLNDFLIKNTNAAPKDVPKNGISIPMITFMLLSPFFG